MQAVTGERDEGEVSAGARSIACEAVRNAPQARQAPFHARGDRYCNGAVILLQCAGGILILQRAQQELLREPPCRLVRENAFQCRGVRCLRAGLGATDVRAFFLQIVIIGLGAVFQMPASCLGDPRTPRGSDPLTDRPSGRVRSSAQDELKEPPWESLGIGLESTNRAASSENTLVVDTVVPGGAMDRAGIRRLDIIREIARTEVHSPEEAARLFQSASGQEGVAILVQRGGKVFLTGVYLRPDTAVSW